MAKKYNEIEAKDNMRVEKDAPEELGTQEKKKLTKLIDKKPKKLKRNLVSRLITGIVGPEGLPGVGSYVNDEIIKPALRNLIFDAINSTARMMLFKDGGGPPSSSGHSHPSRRAPNHRPSVNYSNRYVPPTYEPQERKATPRSSRHGVEEYVIEERFDAAHVLTALTEHADMYDVVSIADYYDLINVSTEYTDDTYGWTIDSITQASIMPVRGGYVIKFPPVEVI